ncbi:MULTISPECIES: leucyl aminopeptidase [Chlamydia]|uniref:Probable cytosol aminopeptidase n=1 Tax=Chlamydophila parapsittaci TaxID=344886 RepID=A0ABX5W0H0_9CHLA|nr:MULTISPECIES: leucyl aminopeptidase [Chlamydia]EPJ32677.1 cytosol aminopeptidase family, catalytic domain protein [Chlamydia psittaci 06-1683]AFS20539.1 cytosol aminopeptidase family, catalytic domain protein [Chlamydia psittaci GR9]AFS24229.1 cytosol aminopeptidase family, catalytic domain protein [Chlamydia psittaci WS/RT/E30]EPP29164.1 cytosol aminopeptidase family, catalytic domain protein [Chlamydia psittaci 08-2626_L3]QDE37591.1 leucyl aminopeptidase [Chlamydophila parapsittaci]
MVLFHSQASCNKRVKADAIVLPFWKVKDKPKCAASIAKEYESLYRVALDSFSGEKGEIEFIYNSGQAKEKRLLILGLGKNEELTSQDVLEAYAKVTRALRKAKCTTVNVVLPTISELRIPVEDFLTNLTSGILSLNYNYPKYTKETKKTDPLLTKVTVLGIVPKIADRIFRKEESIFEGVYLTRDLVNGNADEVTPGKLANIAKGLAKEFPSVDAKVLNKDAILKEKMGLLAAVAKGSAVDPCFIVLSYQGKPKSKDHTVLIGKGVTFDSGGLDLKPGKAMLTMKEDMAGAATVLGILSGVAALELPVNVTALIPATENAIDAASYKMGDVYVGMSGLSVEIGSTDAEGRLILADAITYALKYCKPTRIIDFATLTGAMVVSLGEDVAGFFSNNDVLAQDLSEASAETSESLWRLPLVEKYDKALHSDIADMKNIGSNRAGAITAALFLKRFLEDQPVAWAHLDIAGTAYREKDEDAYPKYASGFGVRCLIYYIEKFLSK